MLTKDFLPTGYPLHGHCRGSHRGGAVDVHGIALCHRHESLCNLLLHRDVLLFLHLRIPTDIFPVYEPADVCDHGGDRYVFCLLSVVCVCVCVCIYVTCG